MNSSSEGSWEPCSGHGSPVSDDDPTCLCDDYYTTENCSVNLYALVGDKMQGVEIFWACCMGLLVLYSLFLLQKWKIYRPYTRAAIILVLLAAISDIAFRCIIIPDEIAHKGCTGYNCNLQDSFYGLAISFTGCAFLVLIRSWLTVAALASANACMARHGVKIITIVMVGLSFAGTLVLLIPLGANPRLIMSGYYLIFGLFIAIGFITSGVQVFRIIRKSRDNAALRFTAILWLESLTAFGYLFTSVILVLGNYTHKPSLLFYGAGIVSNLYRFFLLFWLLVLVTPTRSEQVASSHASSQSDTTDSKADKTRLRFDGADSESLFGSLDSSTKTKSNEDTGGKRPTKGPSKREREQDDTPTRERRKKDKEKDKEREKEKDREEREPKRTQQSKDSRDRDFESINEEPSGSVSEEVTNQPASSQSSTYAE